MHVLLYKKSTKPFFKLVLHNQTGYNRGRNKVCSFSICCYGFVIRFKLLWTNSFSLGYHMLREGRNIGLIYWEDTQISLRVDAYKTSETQKRKCVCVFLMGWLLNTLRNQELKSSVTVTRAKGGPGQTTRDSHY